MAKKAKHPEHENLERWLVSYADFITLLFATFTALYALAQTDISKLKGVGEAIREGFEQQSLISGIQSVLQGKNPPSRNPDPISSEKGAGPGVIGKFDSMTYKPGEVKAVKEVAEKLATELDKLNQDIEAINQAAAQAGKGQKSGSPEEGDNEGGAQGGEKSLAARLKEDPDTPLQPIKASIQERGIRISLDSRLLFAPGSAVLQASGKKFVDGVAERLHKLEGNIIHVEGHTDDTPISTALYPSNWELSGARSSSLVRYLIGQHHYSPQTLVTVGYGSTQPLASNNTAEGRAKNRRVDIVIYSQKTSALVNPRVQYMKETAIMTHSESSHPGEMKELPELPAAQTGPVRVIIKDKDGTERILIPKTTTQEAEKDLKNEAPKAQKSKPAPSRKNHTSVKKESSEPGHVTETEKA